VKERDRAGTPPVLDEAYERAFDLDFEAVALGYVAHSGHGGGHVVIHRPVRSEAQL
jgi:hypothetical protein